MQRPTEEELQKIVSFSQKNSDAVLDRPEQFLMDLSRISCYEERLCCMMLKTTVTDSLLEIGQKLTNFRLVCKVQCVDKTFPVLANSVSITCTCRIFGLGNLVTRQTLPCIFTFNTNLHDESRTCSFDELVAGSDKNSAFVSASCFVFLVLIDIKAQCGNVVCTFKPVFLEGKDSLV